MLKVAAAGKGVGAIEDADIVEAEEAAAEDVAAVQVLAVDPPGEVEEEFLEGFLKEENVAAALFIRDLVNTPYGPGVDGRVDVGEIPFVGGKLAVGVHIPLS